MKGFGLFLLSFRPLILVFFIILFGVRCYEVAQFDFTLVTVNPINTFFIGIIQDSWFSVLLWFFIALVSYPIHLINPRVAYRFSVAVVAIITLFHIGFSYYFLLMNKPVDESLFFFSVQELTLIIGLTNRINLPIILLFIVLLLAFSWGIRYLKKKTPLVPDSKGIVAYFVMFVCALVFSSIINYTNENDKLAESLVANKSAYFIGHSLTYFTADDQAQSKVKTTDFKRLSPAFYGRKSVNHDQYPLMHATEAPSTLAPFLTRTKNKKQPDIVVVIVESLSTELVGKYAYKTGHLMPFLDSLSQKAIYFPNTLSTAQRTHNVLPALLASVPNTIDGAVFQQIDYPDHFSLFNLLRKSYYTRFYCGVLLEYINMRGFMNYHHVAQLSDKWHPKIKAHSDLVNSPWGIPDNDLFHQAQLDFNKSNYTTKNRFDVFLTISTHDPYVYPNKVAYTQVASQRISQINDSKTRNSLLPKASELGSFCYTDEALRTFFEREKKLPNYENTIYILTGDHGSELCALDPVSNYKVPLLIVSSLLKSPKRMNNIVSHLDIPPTILSLLHHEYNSEVPMEVPFVGKELDMRSGFHNQRSFVFTTSQLKTSDLYQNGIFFIGNNCYSTNHELKPTKINSHQLKRYFKRQLTYYQRFSRYTINQNKLIPPFNFKRFVEQKVWKKELTAVASFTRENSQKKMTLFSKVPLKNLIKHELKIEVKSSVFLKKPSDLNNYVDFVIANSEITWPKKSAVLYTALRPIFTGKFKPNQQNEIVFTVQFDPRFMHQLTNKSTLYFYLHRTKARKKLFSHLESNISINKK
jgi:phosphoglycerol transferase MdoB-like AlkP superfamily enzyme